MQLRLFFPLWSMTTLLGEVSSAHKQESCKLKTFGINYLFHYIHSKSYKKYPFKIIIKFFIFSDIETSSLLLLSAYITNKLGVYTLQSDDYRVIPTFELQTKKITNKDKEGCEIIIEPFKP